MTQQPQTLSEWYSTFDADDFVWIDNYQHRRDKIVEERNQRKQARKRRDRRYFGETIKVITDPTTKDWFVDTYQLPQFSSEIALAEWLDIPISRLRWFTYDNPAETAWHYTKTVIPKRSGGKRVILAPKPELKAIQRRILDEILVNFHMEDCVHGFVQGRSIVTNAVPHVGKAYVAKLDLKNYFPKVTTFRVQRFFAKIYPSAVATALALLMTEYDREPVEHQGKTYYVSIGNRHLVQGAPTSPMMANILTRQLDLRLTGLAQSHGFAYTRYADDLTFSGDNHDTAVHLLSIAQDVIRNEGFVVNQDKLRILSQATRQHVTGVIVNERLSSPRETRRKLRAILHNAQQTGLSAQNRENHPAFHDYLRGLIAHLHNINPEQAHRYLVQLEALSD
ncbi:MAG: reverse transcriptase family protein [Chloroflexota bacterium]